MESISLERLASTLYGTRTFVALLHGSTIVHRSGGSTETCGWGEISAPWTPKGTAGSDVQLRFPSAPWTAPQWRALSLGLSPLFSFHQTLH